MTSTKPVTDATFDEDVLRSGQPVLVDFWAPWCGPCRQLAPVLETISQEHGDKLVIATVNIDDNRETGRRYGIRATPTMHVFRDGKIVKTIIGAKPKAALLRELQEFV
jgi:thioredoxin 1